VDLRKDDLIKALRTELKKYIRRAVRAESECVNERKISDALADMVVRQRGS
jgi:hypothetical protein